MQVRFAANRVAALAAAAVVAVACGSSSTSGSGSVAPGTIPAGTYTFGVEGDLSGANASVGTPQLAGIQAAFDQANSAGTLGKGVTLKVSVKDDQAVQAQAIPVINGFINDQSIVGLICCVLSGATGTIKPLLEQAQIASVVTSAGLLTATGGCCLYRAYPAENILQPLLVDAIVKTYQIKQSVTIVDSDNPSPVGIGGAASAELIKDGVQSTTINILSADKDMTVAATSVMAKNPQLVAVDTLTPQVPVLMRQLRNDGYKGFFMSTASIEDSSLLKSCESACVGALSSTAYLPIANSSYAYMNTWLPMAQKASGQTVPSEQFAYGWLAAQFMMQGLVNAEKLVPGKITRASLLKGVQAVTAMTGTPFGDLTFSAGQGNTANPKFLYADASGNEQIWDGQSASVPTPA